MAESWDEKLEELKGLGTNVSGLWDDLWGGAQSVVGALNRAALATPIVLLVAAGAYVALLIVRAWPLYRRREAIGNQARQAFVTAVGNARGQRAAASAQGAASIIRQCVVLFVVCSSLAGLWLTTL